MPKIAMFSPPLGPDFDLRRQASMVTAIERELHVPVPKPPWARRNLLGQIGAE